MKINKQIVAAALAAVSVTSASAADVIINITGSTAFRSAIHTTIQASMTGEEFTYVGSSLNGSLYALFQGQLNGLTLTGADKCIIRTSWSGSAQGIGDIATPNAVPVLILDNNGTVNPTVAGQAIGADALGQPTVANVLTTGFAKIALSDVIQASTVYNGGSFPTLSSTVVGVVGFQMVANEVASNPLSNITKEQYRYLLGNGSAPLSFFTGVAADSNRNVYAVGRDSGSGTRAVILAESGYGVFNAINQYLVTSSGGVASALTYVGDGGYSAGSDLRTALGATTAAVSVDGGASENALLIGHAGISDTATIVTNGGKALSFNGVAYSADAVRRGAYTYWSYQNILSASGLSTGETVLKADLIANIPANIGSAGITTTSMVASRPDGLDGGAIIP